MLNRQETRRPPVIITSLPGVSLHITYYHLFCQKDKEIGELASRLNQPCCVNLFIYNLHDQLGNTGTK